MKNLRITLFLISLVLHSSSAQEVNWKALTDASKHLASAYFGADYSSYYGVSYGYIIKTKQRPLVIGAAFKVPFGKQTFDDWKGSINIQGELWKNELLSLSLKPSLIVRRYASPLARFYNIGADVSLMFGVVKPTWGLVALGNYDHAFSTHIKHGLLKTYYPEIRDGWYGSSGGNFKFGARVHASFKSWSTFLTIGKHFGQNFKDNPTLPFFAEFSVQRQF